MLLSPSQSPTLQPSRWDPVVITFVGSICIIFLLFSYYKVLRQHCCSSPAVNFSRNRNQRQRLNENNLDEPSLQFPSQGLDSYIMRTLPTMQFKKDREESKQKNTDCAVCLGEFEDGEWLKNLPNCSHVFHVACIDTWFQTHSTCPLCRSGVFNLEYSVPIYNLNETSSREELTEERAAFYHVLRSHILRTTNLS